jgi:hypothetical protein
MGIVFMGDVLMMRFRYYFEPRFEKHGETLKPEARLPMSMLGAFCFPVSPHHPFSHVQFSILNIVS